VRNILFRFGWFGFGSVFEKKLRFKFRIEFGLVRFEKCSLVPIIQLITAYIIDE